MATPVRPRFPDRIEGMPRDPYGAAFVRGAQDGANASHYRAMLETLTPAQREAVENYERVHAKVQALANRLSIGPFKKTPKGEKRGALYTLQDIQRTTAANKAVANAKAKEGLSKASRSRALQRTRDTGVFRRAPTYGGVASAGHEIISIYTEIARRQRQLREQRRQRLALGRRGALAARPWQPMGRTNRTGAAASRPFIPERTVANTAIPGISGAVSGLPGTGTNSRDAVRPVSRSSGGMSADQRARTIMGSAPKLPSATTTRSAQSSKAATRSGSRLGSFLNLAMGTLLPRSARSAMSSRMPSRAASTLNLTPLLSATGSASAPTMGTSLIPLTAGATSTQGCNCPKPKDKRKEKKTSAQSCRNPVVSKIIRDGFITIKRKLTCPPSKPKLP